MSTTIYFSRPPRKTLLKSKFVKFVQFSYRNNTTRVHPYSFATNTFSYKTSSSSLWSNKVSKQFVASVSKKAVLPPLWPKVIASHLHTAPVTWPTFHWETVDLSLEPSQVKKEILRTKIPQMWHDMTTTESDGHCLCYFLLRASHPPSIYPQKRLYTRVERLCKVLISNSIHTPASTCFRHFLSTHIHTHFTAQP